MTPPKVLAADFFRGATFCCLMSKDLSRLVGKMFGGQAFARTSVAVFAEEFFDAVAAKEDFMSPEKNKFSAGTDRLWRRSAKPGRNFDGGANSFVG